MIPSLDLTRRGLLSLAVQGLVWMRGVGTAASLSSGLEVDRLASERPDGAITAHSRRYRVHATISLLSVPLFSKDNVGGACVIVEQAGAGTSRTTALQFTSGSWPDRLRGLNRFGMTQEVVREEASVIQESAYFGFMTTSAEKNFEQARRAFVDNTSSTAITVSHGAARPTAYTSALDRLTVPAGYAWSSSLKLRDDIHGRLSTAVEAAVEPAAGTTFPTFLYSVRKAMLDGAESSRCDFVHNAKLCRLRTHTSRAGGLTLLSGWIAEHGSRHESEFRVWFDPRDTTQLPVRIEFRPKSYLHLVFEQDPTSASPAFRCLLSQEQA